MKIIYYNASEKMNSNFKFGYSFSVNEYDRNQNEKDTFKLKWKEREGTTTTLINDIKNNRAFCPCFYHEGDTFSNKDKSDSKLKSTHFIVYDFDAVRLTASDFYAVMMTTEIPPTIVYTTANNGKFKSGKNESYNNRYRVVYVLDAPIYNADLYKEIHRALKEEISITIDDLSVYNDNSDSSVSHFFAGNKNAEVYSGECVLSLEWLSERYELNIEGNKKPQHGQIISRESCNKKVQDRQIISHEADNNTNKHGRYIEYFIYNKLGNEKVQDRQIIKKEGEHYISTLHFFENDQFISDYYHLSINQIIEKYISVYPSYEFTQVEFDETQPYYMVPNDYLEIKRKWHFAEVKKSNGDTYKVTQIERCKNGQGRRRRLFLNLVIRRLIYPQISFENLLFNALYELHHFIDNNDKDDIITKKEVAEIAVNAYFEDIKKWSKLKEYHKPKYKINKEWCVENGIKPRQQAIKVRGELNKQAKQSRDAEITKYYNPQLKDKDNLALLNENGVKLSLRTLKKWKKENGYTKSNKSKQQTTAKEPHRATQGDNNNLMEQQPTTTATEQQSATERANNTLMEQQPTATANGSQRATQSENNRAIEQQHTTTANEPNKAVNEVMSMEDAQSIISELHPYYSEGAKIEKIAKNKYLVTLANKVFQHDLLKVFEGWLDAQKISLTKIHLINGIGDGFLWNNFEMGVIA